MRECLSCESVEGTYQVYNGSLGYIELYLQPGESAAGQQNYRAVFSLIA